MAYQKRSQDFLFIPNADYCQVIEVDFDSFEPGLAVEQPCNVPEDMGRSKLRVTLLVDEPRRLYNAMSFLTWQTGLCFNAHVTLTVDLH